MVIILIFTAALVLAREGVGMFERPTARARIAMFTGDTSWLSSEEGRLRLLAQAWEQVSEAPILGHGTGASYRTGRGSHNMYLDVWVQWGLPGLGAYLAFLLGSTWYFARRRFLPGLLLMPVIFFWGLLQHGLLDERGLVMLYGLLLGISALERASETGSIELGHESTEASRASRT
jgi:O-antigen ligase